ncbi:hypothetical protein GCM10025857_44240 [Alicyclobacillus contaminans]|nr:hypothetical protein GCM10025857_44240 [Alicyclobacillus contaminans]
MDKTQHIDGHNSKENASQSQHAGHLPGEVLMYFIGLIIYLLALFVPFAGATSNYLFTAAVVLSGFHVIVEGVTETIKNTKEKESFNLMCIY